jgi:outer membrane protein OmpA-like peptidoglycan-associated protein
VIRRKVAPGGWFTLFAAACFASGVCEAVDLAPSKSISFIGCPIYRDTNQGRKTGCWLADEFTSGVRYDIGSGRSKPQIGHEVLVEGLASTEPNSCGGVVLVPVHIAVLESRCPVVMLPAEGFSGRVFHVSMQSVLPPMDVQRPDPPPPYSSRDWAIEFNFDSDFLLYQYSEVILDEAARYINVSRPRSVAVTGYAATGDLHVSGRTLAEPDALAKARATSVAEALRRLGVNAKLLRVEWHGDGAAAVAAVDGLAETSKRRVTIHVEE